MCFLAICLDRELFSERVFMDSKFCCILFILCDLIILFFNLTIGILLLWFLAGLKSVCYAEIEFIISVTNVTEQLGSLEVKIDASFKRKDGIYGIFHD